MAALFNDADSGVLANRRVLFWNTYNSLPYPDDVMAADLTRLPSWLHKYLTS